jgi:hypothetical protein
MTTSRRLAELLIRTTAVAVVFMSATAWGYYYIFSRFSWYDDEGYVMLSVRLFSEGRALYDDVYSQYGPFYYATRLALLSALQVPVSHDLTRLVTLATWVAVSALLAFSVFRMSRSLVAATAGYLILFHHLRPLAHEPGHPQEVGLLLLAAIVALSAWWNEPARAGRLMAGVGALVAALVLTKINVGAYGLIAVATWAVTFAPTSARSSVMALAAVVAFALPWWVMRDHIGAWSGCAALISLGSVAVVVASYDVSSERPIGIAPKRRLLLGGLAATAATCVVVLARGTSPTGLVDGVVLQPLRFARIVFTEIHIANQAVAAAAVSLAVALLYVCIHPKTDEQPTPRGWMFWWLKLAGGLLGVSLAVISRHTLFAVGPALLWLVLVRPFGRPWQYGQWMPRVMLVCLASLQTLQVYPMAESQVAWATFLMIPAMGLVVVDAIAGLSATRAGRTIREGLPAGSILGTAGLVAIVILYQANTNALAARQRYLASSALSLPGSSRVRLPAAEVDRYQWLVDQVQARCATVITLPGLNSLFFWSDLEPPTGLNTTAWPVLLGQQQQQRIVDAVQAREQVCVVEYPQGIRTFGRAEEINQLPLMRFVRDTFDVVAERDGYRLMLRREAAKPGQP